MTESNAAPVVPIAWVIPGIIPTGLTLLAGRPKVGTSWLILDAALALASGQPALGQRDAPAPGRVFYLGFDNSERQLHARAELLRGALPDLPFALATNWPALDAGGLDRLASYLDQFADTKLVVIDPLVGVLSPGSSEANDRAVAGLQRLANDRHIAIVCVITATRTIDGGSDALHVWLATSIGLRAAADATLVLTRVRGEDQGELALARRDAPTRNLAMHIDPAQSRWTITGDAHPF